MRISDWSSDVCSSDLTEALLHGRFIRQRADQPLAARPQQNRAAEPVEQRKSVQQIEIVPQPLAETDAGIDDDPLAGYPSRFGRRYPALQPVIDLDQRIGIARLVLQDRKSTRLNS